MILASNHRSFLDSIFVPLVIAAASRSWRRPSTSTDRRRRGSSAASVRSRSGARAAARARARSARPPRCSRQGGVFGIYPEGTRTRDGYSHSGQTRRRPPRAPTGAPIVPVGMVGTDECQPTDKKLPRCSARSRPLRRRRSGAEPLRGPTPRASWRASSPTSDVRDRAAVRATSTATPTRRSRPRTSRPELLASRRSLDRRRSPPEPSLRSYSRPSPRARSTPRAPLGVRARRRRVGIARHEGGVLDPRGGRLVGRRPTRLRRCPARNAAPSAVVSCDRGPRDGHAEQVGLELAEQVHDRGAAVDAQLGRRRVPRRRGHRVDDVARLVRHRLDDGAGEVRAAVPRRDADDRAARVRDPSTASRGR